jgi:hypothetical protein
LTAVGLGAGFDYPTPGDASAQIDHTGLESRHGPGVRMVLHDVGV